MKDSLVRGLAALVIAGTVAAIANCGDGERPLAAIDNPTVTDGGSSGSVIGNGNFSIGPLEADGSLNFGDKGLVNCGTQAPDKVITITNTSNAVINYKAEITAGITFFKVAPETGGVPAGAKATINISATPIPQTSDVTTDLYAGTLQITTSPTDPPTSIRLHQSAEGVIISTTSDKGIDFGAVKVGNPVTQLFNLNNLGNVDTSANIVLGSTDFKIDGSGAATVPLTAGATGSKNITLTPASATSYTDTITVSFPPNTVHCKPPPSSVKLTAIGTTSTGVTVAPLALNFGSVNCGATYVDTNNANLPYQKIQIATVVPTTFTPTLGLGGTSFYTLINDADGSVVTQGVALNLAANAVYTMRVQPIAIPARPAQGTAVNAFGDILTISTSADPTPKAIPLTQTARGAIFAFNPLIVKGDDGPYPVQLQNTGNLAGAYTTLIIGGLSTVSPANGTAQVNPTTTLIITKKGAGSLHVAGDATTVLCKDLPGDLPIVDQ